jgi:hypothetical protein
VYTLVPQNKAAMKKQLAFGSIVQFPFSRLMEKKKCELYCPHHADESSFLFKIIKCKFRKRKRHTKRRQLRILKFKCRE